MLPNLRSFLVVRYSFFKFFLLIHLLLQTFSFSAFAKVSFYLGADANYQNLLISSKTGIKPNQEIKNSSDFYKTQTFAPSLYFGFDNNRNLRLELGASAASGEKTKKDAFSSETSYPVSTKFKITTRVYSVEFKPYYDLSKKSLIYGIIGLNYFNILLEREAYADVLGVRYTDRERSNSKSIAPTVGFGGEYSLNSHIFLRTQLKYAHINAQTKYVENNRELIKYKGAITASLGLGYRF